MVYNAARRRDVREAEKAAKIAERQRHEIIYGIMSVAPGRSWVLDLLEFCSVFGTTFSPNTSLAAFKEGQRNVGIRLLNDIMQACPDQYVLMMRERNEKDAARGRSSDERDERDSGTGFDSSEHARGEEPGWIAEGGTVGDSSDGTEAEWRDEVYGDAKATGAKDRST